MAQFAAQCPDCWADTVHACTGVMEFIFPWAKAFGCVTCRFSWFVCGREGCQIPTLKNVLHTRRQLKDHARHWHVRRSNLLPHIEVVPPTFELAVNPNNDILVHTDCDEEFETQHSSHSTTSNVCCWHFVNPGTAEFAKWCILASVSVARSCLVQQALLQAPVSIYMEASYLLPKTTVQLFLSIAKLVVNTGAKQHIVLCHILQMLFGMLPKGHHHWPTMPCSLAAFQSHILNATNTHALVSLLPGPLVTMVDADHAYSALEEIAAFILLLPRTIGAPPTPLRLRQLCQSFEMQRFLTSVKTNYPDCLVSIGLLFWLDGWDPSASSKNNRTPVHTASATFLLIDNSTQAVFDCRTFPIACGPGKVDHNNVFQAIKTSLSNMIAPSKQMWSHHHGRWTTICSHVIAFLMDQPERRGSTCLLGGNGKQHPLFGISCNFLDLACSFEACPNCLKVARLYLAMKCFDTPPVFECSSCYSYSLTRLLLVGKRKAPVLPRLTPDAPGHFSTSQPGQLSLSMLLEGWQYAVQKYVVEHQWTQTEVVAYFNLLCINTVTIEHFTTCSRNHVLLQDIAEQPDEYSPDMLALVTRERQQHPDMYNIPCPQRLGVLGR